MKQDFRQSTRNTVYTLVAVYAAVAFILFACTEGRPATGVKAATLANADVPTVTDARICAAAAAYTLATGDHFDQRAAVALASLNRFDRLGHVPDCGQALTSIVAAGVDPYLWQASLDAVDAVQSGSFALPHACVRADTVSPAVQAKASPLSPADSARTHCVIGDLAFYAGGAL